MPSIVNGKGKRNSSRLSSPPTRTATDAKASGFVEPPLATKPSYEDHPGGGAFGTMADMQALGQLPNAKVKARVRGDPARRSILGKHAAHLGADMQDTPEGTPAFETRAGSGAPEADLPLPLALPILDDERDQDYTPGAKKKSTRSRLSRGTGTPLAAAAGTPTPAPAPTPAKRTETPSSANSSRPPSVPVPSTSRAEDKRLQGIVDAAVERSKKVGNPILGQAIQDIYLEGISNPHLKNLLFVMLGRDATEEQQKEFRDLINRAKKRIRAGANVDASDEAGTAPSSGRSRTRSTAPGDGPARPSIEVSAPTRKGPRISLKVKSPEKKSSGTKGDSGKDITGKKRSDSVSSTSSLSSLTSFDDDAEDLMEVDEGGQADAKPNGRLTIVPSHRGAKRSSADADLPPEDRDKTFAAKKQKYQTTLAITRWDDFESDVRDRDSRKPKPMIRLHHSAHPTDPPVRLVANGQAKSPARNKGPAVDSDIGSPLSELSSPASSPRGTPQRLDMPVRGIKKKAKTKQSPEKKQTAYHAMGEPGSSGGRGSPIGYDDNEVSENNDFCESCGGSGYLLCCDGCERSFHFSCLDPPISQDASELDEPWFCFKCLAKRDEPKKRQRGLFAALLSNLEQRNPSTYLLPQDIREYFVDVGTGKDGRFTTATGQKTRSRAGYDELPDLLKIKDGKGNVILCYQCGKSSTGRREIITCDFCNEHWHLDCLDPPRANPPARGIDGRKIGDWMCPLHVDHELAEIDTSRLVREPGNRKIRIRKPRNARVVDTALQRGFANNGLVEIQNDSSDEDSEFYEEENEQGTIFRLPEKGVKLDFIDKVKRVKDASYFRRMQQIALVEQQKAANRERFQRRSFVEQKVALNLAQLAQQTPDLNISGDQVENLVDTLIAEAPSDVVEKMTAAENLPPSPPSDGAKELSEEQRQELLMLQELIRRRLEGSVKTG